MSTTYAQRQNTAQKKDAPTAASVLDSSSQSESLQRKADMANNAAQRAEAPRPNNTGMPDNLKSGIESLSGFSMDDVRVHYNSSKPATVQALAYTQGTDIHVAPGQEKHLPHEAWHVAQQMAGRVSPTTNINGMPVNDNPALEHEADVMGEKAVQIKKSSEVSEKKMSSNCAQLFIFSKVDNRATNLTPWILKRLINQFNSREIVLLFKFLEGASAEIAIGNVQSYFFVAPQNIDLLKNELIKLANSKLLEDRAYWISWPEYATGDLPSMAVAILRGFNHGIKIDPEKGNKKEVEADIRKLKEVAPYLGCIVVGKYAVDSNLKIKATVDKNVDPLGSKEVLAGVRGKKFSWLTHVVATGKYVDEKNHYYERGNKRGRGLTKLNDFKNIRRSWFGVIDANRKKEMKKFLERKGLNVTELNGKAVEVLWIRTSGEKGGAHYENDTSFNAIKNYIEKNRNKFFILAGDEKNGKAERIASENENVFNLTEFWNDSKATAPWGGNSRTGQFAIYEYLKCYCGCSSFKHIGSMSGGLEAMALIGHDVEFKAKKNERGVERVEKYALYGGHVHYNENPFFSRNEVLTNGYEKRTAKYFNLFSNFKYDSTSQKDEYIVYNIVVGTIKNSFLKVFNETLKKMDSESAKKKTFKPIDVLEVLFNTAQNQTNEGFNHLVGRIGIETAKKFAKIEKENDFCIGTYLSKIRKI